MRTTITILTFALLLGAWVTPAEAQRRGGPPDPETRIERMTARLDLTESQAAQMRAIFREQASARREIFDEGRGPEAREQMLELRKRTHERLAEVLTDEQRDRMRQMRQSPRDRRGGPDRPMHRRPGARGNCRS